MRRTGSSRAAARQARRPPWETASSSPSRAAARVLVGPVNVRACALVGKKGETVSACRESPRTNCTTDGWTNTGQGKQEGAQQTGRMGEPVCSIECGPPWLEGESQGLQVTLWFEQVSISNVTYKDALPQGPGGQGEEPRCTYEIRLPFQERCNRCRHSESPRSRIFLLQLSLHDFDWYVMQGCCEPRRERS